MKVSIITPFYYGNEYLPAYQEMIDANEETLKERCGEDDSLEVILVNDSPDCAMRIQGIYNGRANWKQLKNRRNMGIHASRLAGLAEATGDHVIFLDQDDALSDDAVAEFVLAAREDPYKVIVSNAVLETASGPKLWYRTRYHSKLIGRIGPYLTVGTQIISPGQALIPTMVIPDFWRRNVCEANGSDDYFLWLLMLQNGIDFKYLDLPLYTHRRTGGNLSTDTALTDKSSYDFIRLLENDTDFPEDRVYRLKRMIIYKAGWRRGGFFDKLMLSIRNFDLFAKNVWFKLRTATPYGFNR